MALGGFVLGSLIIFLKGRTRTMFQLSGFYYKRLGFGAHGLGFTVMQGPQEVDDVGA